jgi:hypothetical protein
MNTEQSRAYSSHAWDWNRLLSGAVALVWLGVCVAGAGGAGLVRALLSVTVPLACIWFPDSLPANDRPFTRTMPGMIRFFGWVALLALTIARVAIWAWIRP